MNEQYMKIALKEAQKCIKEDEVPIGAVIVKDGKIIAKAHNEVEKRKNPLCHAELLAIKKACKKVGDWRLDGTTIYVTLEPCSMCAGGICNSRIGEVVFGAYEKKSGCATSLYPILENNGLNHKVKYIGGILEDECSLLLKEYFKRKRAKNLT